MVTVNHTRLPLEVVQNIANQLVIHTPQAILKRGLAYFHEQHVKRIDVFGDQIRAAVTGSTTYHVETDATHFLLSSLCTCPYDGLCKHIAAVCFALYAEHGNPDALFNPQLPQLSTSTMNPIGATSTWLELWEFVTHQSRQLVLPPPSSWDFRPYAIAIERSVSALIAYGVELSLPQQQVFHLFVRMAVANRIVSDCHQAALANPYYGGYQLQEAIIYPLTTTFVDTFEELTDWNWAAFDAEVPSRIADMVRVILLDSSKLRLGFVRLYEVLWRKCSPGHALFAREVLAVDAELAHCSDEAYRRALVGAKEFLWLLQGQDEQLMASKEAELAERSEFAGAFIACKNLIRVLIDMEAWPRVHHWLAWLDAFMQNADTFEIQHYCEHWSVLARYQAVDETCIAVLRQNRQVAWYVYTRYLVQTERDKEWASYHLAAKDIPTDIDKEQLKTIEGRNLAVLLPLYHHGVEHCVQMKNRRDYKLAVRLLKKLAMYYKRTKQVEQWQWFIADFSKRYARYRALQEELKKGRLIV